MKKPRNGDAQDLTYGMAPCPPDQKGEFAVVPVLLSTLNGITHIRIYLPKDIRPLEARATALKHVNEVRKRFKDNIMLLDPKEHMGIKDEEFAKLVKVSLITASL